MRQRSPDAGRRILHIPHRRCLWRLIVCGFAKLNGARLLVWLTKIAAGFPRQTNIRTSAPGRYLSHFPAVPGVRGDGQPHQGHSSWEHGAITGRQDGLRRQGEQQVLCLPAEESPWILLGEMTTDVDGHSPPQRGERWPVTTTPPENAPHPPPEGQTTPSATEGAEGPHRLQPTCHLKLVTRFKSRVSHIKNSRFLDLLQL